MLEATLEILFVICLCAECSAKRCEISGQQTIACAYKDDQDAHNYRNQYVNHMGLTDGQAILSVLCLVSFGAISLVFEFL